MSARAAILAALGDPPRDPATLSAEAAALLTRPERPAATASVDALIEALAAPSVAATCERLAGSAELPEAVARYLASSGLPPELMIADSDLAQMADWSRLDILAAPPIDGGAVLTRAKTAVCETGSLVLETGPGKPMLANFLALHHLVVVFEDSIVAHLEDIPQPALAPRAHYWVTGVSGTTDIEGQYVRGAHGPRFLHVLTVQNVNSTSNKRDNR